MKMDVDVETGIQDILPDVTGIFGFGDGLPEAFGRCFIGPPQENIGIGRLDGIRRK